MAFRDNFGNPQGFIGRLMLSGMNMGHSPMLNGHLHNSMSRMTEHWLISAAAVDLISEGY